MINMDLTDLRPSRDAYNIIQRHRTNELGIEELMQVVDPLATALNYFKQNPSTRLTPTEAAMQAAKRFMDMVSGGKVPDPSLHRNGYEVEKAGRVLEMYLEGQLEHRGFFGSSQLQIELQQQPIYDRFGRLTGCEPVEMVRTLSGGLIPLSEYERERRKQPFRLVF